MTPAQRIALITESARLLASREWMELDLILRQHGLPTTDDALGGPYPYAIAMLDQSDDDVLNQIHKFLTGGVQEDSQGEAQPWQQGRLKLFMSHLSEHQGFVGSVSTALSGLGVSAFVAHSSIDPSKEWEAVIETALRSCDAMVVFLHTGFRQSSWCDQEVGFALARRVPIFLIALGEMPYGFMGKYQAFRPSLTTPPIASAIAWSTADWLTRTPTAQEPMTEGLVGALQQSSSYDQTRKLIAFLQKVPRFTPSQLGILSTSARENSQVRDANVSGTSVPQLIQQLVSLHGAPVPAADASPFDSDPVAPPWGTELPF